MPRAPQRGQEIPAEQMSGGALRGCAGPERQRGPGPPGGDAGVAAAPGAWQARAG